MCQIDLTLLLTFDFCSVLGGFFLHGEGQQCHDRIFHLLGGGVRNQLMIGRKRSSHHPPLKMRNVWKQMQRINSDQRENRQKLFIKIKI